MSTHLIPLLLIGAVMVVLAYGIAVWLRLHQDPWDEWDEHKDPEIADKKE